MSPLYVYAVLRAAPQTSLGVGLRGEPLQLIECGDLLAAAGQIQGAPAVEATALRDHDTIVRRLAEMVDALLPARFGSLVEGHAALAERLGSARAGLHQALDLVAGREQMTLRLYGERPAVAKPSDAETSSSSAGPGTRYLAERLLASKREGHVPEIDRLRPTLARVVVAERFVRHPTVPLIASVYHLIPRGAAARYAATVHAAATAVEGVRLAVSGPCPPYAFASERQG